jgi:hypothetical protein
MVREMPIYVLVSALVALVSCVSAEERGFTTAIFATPIHEAQVVRADDGMDHVEYELLLVNVFASPVTLSSLAVFDTSGQGLTRIEGNTLLAATQTLLAQTKGTTIPASAAASVDVDLRSRQALRLTVSRTGLPTRSIMMRNSPPSSGASAPMGRTLR